MSQFYDDVPLQLPNGDTHYPRTKTNSVWDANGERLDNVLKGLLDYATPLPVGSKNQVHDITTYPMGVSMTRSTNTSGGWAPTPICNIITFRTQEDRGTQLLIGENNTISVRSRASSGWSDWETLSLGSHTHDDRYYTETEINTKLNAKADNSHTHDDRYYTETEINTKLNAKADNSQSLTANLTVAGWSGTSAPYTQVVTVSGVTASNNIMFDLGMGVTAQQYEQGTDAMLKATAQGTNTVTIKAFGDKPTVNIPVQFVILG